MSSNSNESTDNTEMIAVIKELLRNLHILSIRKTEGPWVFHNVEKLYEVAYQFARRTHLHPDFRQLLTVEDKNLLKEHFPKAFDNLVGYTPGLVNNIGPSNLNVARTRLSQLWFVKNELLDLYKEVSENDLPKEMEGLLNKLEVSNNILDNKILDWTSPDDDDEAVDNPDQVPNLNGVPESHDWWKKEHRDMWKDKKE